MKVVVININLKVIVIKALLVQFFICCISLSAGKQDAIYTPCTLIMIVHSFPDHDLHRFQTYCANTINSRRSSISLSW